MQKFIKATAHTFVFAYVFWWTLTRDFEYIYSYYATALKGG